MAKKQFFLILDTETTQDQKVADFGAVICDRKGEIVAQCAVLVNGIFTDMVNHPLFFTSDPEGIWSKKGQDNRYASYTKMLESGSRMLASVAGINRWLEKVAAKYNPIITAYNLEFDRGKCHNTGIDLTLFPQSFCLWSAAFTKWAKTKSFREMVLATHSFNPPTSLGNMTFQTNAEIMARFVLGNPNLPDEPHTALEDIIFYELPIFKALAKTQKTSWFLEETQAYNWRDCQVKDWFKVR